jgi:hypothetical protein
MALRVKGRELRGRNRAPGIETDREKRAQRKRKRN